MDIIIFILVLGTIILIHEFAHFYFARKADILCHEFAIGMGPIVYQKKKGETLYSIRAIPLGGYVSMAGEEVSDFVKVGNNVGINLDENNNVKEIILRNEAKYDFIGVVVDKDLYGDSSELYITLRIQGEEKRYSVNKNAMYILSPKKKQQLSIAERSYENKTLWQRFKVVAAGPISNFLLAFVILFVIAFFIGKPNNNLILGEVSQNALSYGIKPEDTITKVNGTDVKTFDDLSEVIRNYKKDKITLELNNNTEIEVPLLLIFNGLGFTNIQGNDELVIGKVIGRTKNLEANDIIKSIAFGENLKVTDPMTDVNSWEELISLVEQNKNSKQVRIKVIRDGSDIYTTYNLVKADTLNKLDSDFIDYSIGISGTNEFNILYPLYFPFVKLGGDMKQMFNTIVLLISPSSGVGAGDLAGPVGIFNLVSNARSQGVISFFIFVAFLSVNVGFLNLLPIPALDGGRLVFIAYEAITKKKVNKNVENVMITITFILLIILMIFVTYQDILRLFR